MLTTDQSMDAILKGVHDANKKYIKWSNYGCITDFGLESLISSCVAESLFDEGNYSKKRGFVTLETSFAEFWEYGRKNKRKGRPPDILKKSYKADVVYWCGDDHPRGVIEVKRRFVFNESERDIKRTTELMKKFGETDGGYLRWGAVASFRPRYLDNKKSMSDICDDFVSKCEKKFPGFNFLSKFTSEKLPKPMEYPNNLKLAAYDAYAILFSLK